MGATTIRLTKSSASRCLRGTRVQSETVQVAQRFRLRNGSDCGAHVSTHDNHTGLHVIVVRDARRLSRRILLRTCSQTFVFASGPQCHTTFRAQSEPLRDPCAHVAPTAPRHCCWRVCVAEATQHEVSRTSVPLHLLQGSPRPSRWRAQRVGGQRHDSGGSVAIRGGGGGVGVGGRSVHRASGVRPQFSFVPLLLSRLSAAELWGRWWWWR